MSEAEVLFQPLKVGAITVRNRLAMAPCTRRRADLGPVPPLSSFSQEQRP